MLMLNKHDVAVLKPAQSCSSVKFMCMGCVEVYLISFCPALCCAVLTHALQDGFAVSQLLYTVNVNASKP